MASKLFSYLAPLMADPDFQNHPDKQELFANLQKDYEENGLTLADLDQDMIEINTPKPVAGNPYKVRPETNAAFNTAMKNLGADPEFSSLFPNGNDVTVASGGRSIDEQQALYDRAQKTGGLAAKPGRSKHETGLAMDLNWKKYNPAQQAKIRNAMVGAGFKTLNDPRDPNHFYIDPAASTATPEPVTDFTEGVPDLNTAKGIMKGFDLARQSPEFQSLPEAGKKAFTDFAKKRLQYAQNQEQYFGDLRDTPDRSGIIDRAVDFATGVAHEAPRSAAKSAVNMAGLIGTVGAYGVGGQKGGQYAVDTMKKINEGMENIDWLKSQSAEDPNLSDAEAAGGMLLGNPLGSMAGSRIPVAAGAGLVGKAVSALAPAIRAVPGYAAAASKAGPLFGKIVTLPAGYSRLPVAGAMVGGLGTNVLAQTGDSLQAQYKNPLTKDNVSFPTALGSGALSGSLDFVGDFLGLAGITGTSQFMNKLSRVGKGIVLAAAEGPPEGAQDVITKLSPFVAAGIMPTDEQWKDIGQVFLDSTYAGTVGAQGMTLLSKGKSETELDQAVQKEADKTAPPPPSPTAGVNPQAPEMTPDEIENIRKQAKGVLAAGNDEKAGMAALAAPPVQEMGPQRSPEQMRVEEAMSALEPSVVDNRMPANIPPMTAQTPQMLDSDSLVSQPHPGFSSQQLSQNSRQTMQNVAPDSMRIPAAPVQAPPQVDPLEEAAWQAAGLYEKATKGKDKKAASDAYEKHMTALGQAAEPVRTRSNEIFAQVQGGIDLLNQEKKSIITGVPVPDDVVAKIAALKAPENARVYQEAQKRVPPLTHLEKSMAELTRQQNAAKAAANPKPLPKTAALPKIETPTLDAIKTVGGITPKSQAQNPGGEYDGKPAGVPMGGVNPQGPDQVAKSLADAGIGNGEVGPMIEAAAGEAAAPAKLKAAYQKQLDKLENENRQTSEVPFTVDEAPASDKMVDANEPTPSPRQDRKVVAPASETPGSTDLRERLKMLTPEQKTQEAMLDSNSGLLNERAWDLLGHTGPVIILGHDSSKAFNDSHNHNWGNEAFRVAGQANQKAAKELGLKVYKVGGDILVPLPAGMDVQATTQRLVDRANAIRDTLNLNESVDYKGKSYDAGDYDAIRIRGAGGETRKAAEANFKTHKIEKEGLSETDPEFKPKREELPRGMSKKISPRVTPHEQPILEKSIHDHVNGLPEDVNFARTYRDPRTGLLNGKALEVLEKEGKTGTVETFHRSGDEFAIRGVDEKGKITTISIDLSGIKIMDEKHGSTLTDKFVDRFGAILTKLSGEKNTLAAMEKLDQLLKDDIFADIDKNGVRQKVKFEAWYAEGDNYADADTQLGKFKDVVKERVADADRRPGEHSKSFAGWLRSGVSLPSSKRGKAAAWGDASLSRSNGKTAPDVRISGQPEGLAGKELREVTPAQSQPSAPALKVGPVVLSSSAQPKVADALNTLGKDFGVPVVPVAKKNPVIEAAEKLVPSKTSTPNTSGLTAAMIQQSQPGAKVTGVEGGFVSTMPDGSRIFWDANGEPHFPKNDDTVKASVGDRDMETPVTVAYYQDLPSLDRAGMITMTGDGLTEIDHEVFHAALRLAFGKNTRKEVVDAFREKGKDGVWQDDLTAEENAARAYNDWVRGRRTFTGRILKMFEKIQDFFRNLVGVMDPVWKKAFKDIESGKAWAKGKTVTPKSRGPRMFSVAGEKSLDNLPADEAQIKRDNLAIATGAAKEFGIGDRLTNANRSYVNRIRLATGWFLDVDGKWKYEMDDSGVNLNPALTQPPKSNFMGFSRAVKLIDLMNTRGGYDSPGRNEAIAEIDNFYQSMGYGKMGVSADRDELRQFRTAALAEDMSLLPPARIIYRVGDLKDLISAPDIFKAYPQLGGIVAKVNVGESEARAGALRKSGGKILSITVSAPNVEVARKVFLHEIQHAIQEVEGFGKGGNPETEQSELYQALEIAMAKTRPLGDKLQRGEITEKDYRNHPDVMKANELHQAVISGEGLGRYQRLSGEMSSRDTAYRADLTPAERRRREMYEAVETEDGITPDDAIVKYSVKNLPKMGGEKAELKSEIMSVDIGGKRITVFKNPTSGDYSYLAKRFREDNPDAHPGEPKSRFTFDAEGNKYVWSSGDAVHAQMDPALKKEIGAETNQNPSMISKVGAPSMSDLAIAAKGEKGQKMLSVKDKTKLDEAYLDAVRKGDLESAQRMTDSVAKAAGFTIGPVWHGGAKDFNVFDWSRMGQQGTSEGKGFYFSNDRELAKGYADRHGGRLMKVYLRGGNPLDGKKLTFTLSQVKNILRDLHTQSEKEDEGSSPLWNYGDINYEGLNKVIDGTARDLMDSEDDVSLIGGLINGGANPEKTYDSVYKVTGKTGVVESDAWNKKGHEVYVATSANHVKLADAVTRDDAGNVIPLSKRFDSKSPDIRYSVKDLPKKTAPLWSSRLEDAIANAKQEKMGLDQLAALTKVNVDPEEIAWSGFGDWIEDKKKAGVTSVTKSEALQFLKENGVKIEEVVKGDKYEFYDTAQNRRVFNSKREAQTAFDEEEKWIENESVVVGEDENTITVSTSENDIIAGYEKNEDDEWVKKDPYNWKDDETFTSREEALSDAEEEAEKVKKVWRSEMSRGIRPSEDNDATKFNQYGGGDNYKELLLTLPVEQAESSVEDIRRAARAYRVAQEDATNVYGLEKDKWPEEVKRSVDDMLIAYDKLTANAAQKPNKNYTSPHWSEPNVLAHIRFNERTAPDGKKVMFLEEVQSDWHQAGRKEGYSSKYLPEELSVNQAESDSRDGGIFWVIDAPGQQFQIPKRKYANASDAMAYIVREKEKSSGVPDAPFKKSWPLLSIKRAIRWAAENGFDRVEWTPGIVQVERYQDAIRQKIDEVSWETPTGVPYPEGTRRVDVTKNNDQIAWFAVAPDGKILDASDSRYEDEGKTLDRLVGKDIASKVLAAPTGKLEGDDLSIGGEGMKGFYDQILPMEIQKFIKKFDGKVDTRTNSVRDSHSDGDAGYGEELPFPKTRNVSVQGFNITPKMKSLALEKGMPLFATKNKSIANALNALNKPAAPVKPVGLVQNAINKIAESKDMAGLKWLGNATKRLSELAREDPALPAAAQAMQDRRDGMIAQLMDEGMSPAQAAAHADLAGFEDSSKIKTTFELTHEEKLAEAQKIGKDYREMRQIHFEAEYPKIAAALESIAGKPGSYWHELIKWATGAAANLATAISPMDISGNQEKLFEAADKYTVDMNGHVVVGAVRKYDPETKTFSYVRPAEDNFDLFNSFTPEQQTLIKARAQKNLAFQQDYVNSFLPAMQAQLWATIQEHSNTIEDLGKQLDDAKFLKNFATAGRLIRKIAEVHKLLKEAQTKYRTNETDKGIFAYAPHVFSERKQNAEHSDTNPFARTFGNRKADSENRRLWEGQGFVKNLFVADTYTAGDRAKASLYRDFAEKVVNMYGILSADVPIVNGRKTAPEGYSNSPVVAAAGAMRGKMIYLPESIYDVYVDFTGQGKEKNPALEALADRVAPLRYWLLAHPTKAFNDMWSNAFHVANSLIGDQVRNVFEGNGKEVLATFGDYFRAAVSVLSPKEWNRLKTETWGDNLNDIAYTMAQVKNPPSGTYYGKAWDSITGLLRIPANWLAQVGDVWPKRLLQQVYEEQSKRRGLTGDARTKWIESHVDENSYLTDDIPKLASEIRSNPLGRIAILYTGYISRFIAQHTTEAIRAQAMLGEDVYHAVVKELTGKDLSDPDKYNPETSTWGGMGTKGNVARKALTPAVWTAIMLGFAMMMKGKGDDEAEKLQNLDNVPGDISTRGRIPFGRTSDGAGESYLRIKNMGPASMGKMYSDAIRKQDPIGAANEVIDAVRGVSPVARAVAAMFGFTSREDKYKNTGAIVGEAVGDLATPGLVRMAKDVRKAAGPVGRTLGFDVQDSIPRQANSFTEGLLKNAPVPESWTGKPVNVSSGGVRQYEMADELMKFFGINIKTIHYEDMDAFVEKNLDQLKRMDRLKNLAVAAKAGNAQALKMMKKETPKGWNINSPEDPDSVLEKYDAMSMAIKNAIEEYNMAKIIIKKRPTMVKPKIPR